MASSYHAALGERLRDLRKQRKEPLRIVAAAISIDSTLLSKIERGERLPTEAQAGRFAEYFDVPADDLSAQVIAEKIVAEYGDKATILQAIKIVRERISSYEDKSI